MHARSGVNGAGLPHVLQVLGLDLVKGAVAALFSLIGLIAGGLFAGLFGLPPTEFPPQANMNILLPLVFLSGILVAVLLGECFQRLFVGYWPRMLSIWLCTYLLYYLLNTLDGMLFSPLANMSTAIFSSIFPALFAALAIAFLWRSASVGPQWVGRLRAFFTARRPLAMALRLLLAWLIFPPLYYLVGRLAGLFTLRYYLDPSLDLGLTLPPVGTMLAMQVLRGALFLLAVLPIIVAWRGSPAALWLWMGTIIFVQIAASVVLQGYWLPLAVRIPHGLELLADSYIQAYLYAILLYRFKPQGLSLDAG
jgi:hypothetical protein